MLRLNTWAVYKKNWSSLNVNNNETICMKEILIIKRLNTNKLITIIDVIMFIGGNKIKYDDTMLVFLYLLYCAKTTNN